MKLRAYLALTTLLVALPVGIGFWWLQFYFENRLNEESVAQYVLAYMQGVGRKACEADPENWNGDRHFGMRPQERPGQPDSHDKYFVDAPLDPHQSDFHPPPPHEWDRLYGYNSDFHSSNQNAPVLSPELIEAISEGKKSAQRVIPKAELKGRADFHPPPKPGDDKRGPFGFTPSRPKPPDGPKEHRVQEMLIRMPWNDGPCVYVLAYNMGPHFLSGDRLHIPPVGIWLIPLLSMLAAMLLTVGPIVKRIRRLTKDVNAFALAQYKPALTVTGNDEISELARAFKTAGEEIRTQIAKQELRERTLRNFLENTTHDVMIPLTVLQGYLSDLKDKIATGDVPEPSLLGSAIDETQYLSSLIDNLLLAAKIEEGEPGVQWADVNLNDLVKRVISRHQPIARSKEISLSHATAEDALWVIGDITFIEQAVNNVVYNAIRYNNPGGHVAVILEREDSEMFMLRVIDDGPGIPDEDLSRLTERWYRGNASRTRDSKGQGLGLNIAFQLASLHHWAFELSRSEYGGLQIEISGNIDSSPMQH